MLAQLLEGGPYALGMVQRLRRDHDPHPEPANVFSFPPSRLGEPRSGQPSTIGCTGTGEETGSNGWSGGGTIDDNGAVIVAPFAAVPEPATILLFGLGLAGLFASRKWLSPAARSHPARLPRKSALIDERPSRQASSCANDSGRRISRPITRGEYPCSQ
jgi:hypothetical protein